MFEQKQPLWSRSVAAALAVSLGMSGVGCSGNTEAEPLIADARKYREQGETKAAVIQLKNVIQRDAGNSAARIMLAEVYLDEGDAVSADKELRRARAAGADFGQVAPLLGKALLMHGQFDTLLADIVPEGAPAVRPTVLALRGSALLGLGKREPARELFDDALKLEPNSIDALLGMARLALVEGKAGAAEGWIARALKAGPSDVEALRLRADVDRARHKPGVALAAYKKILELRPGNAQAWIDIANLHIDSGKLNEARDAIAQARKSTPAAVGVIHSQAMLDYREGKHQAALEAAQHILRELPDHMPSILLAAAVQSALGSTQQAAHHLQKFLAAHPRHPYASKLMAAIHIRNNAPAEAMDLLRPLMLDHPGDVELLALAGEAQLRARHFTQAADLFEKAAALRPGAPALHTGLALGSLGSGESGRAIAELERAASLDKGSQRAGILLTMSYLRAKEPGKAMAAAMQMEKSGNNPLIQNLKGGVHLAMHDLDGARASFEAAIKLDPLYLPALDNLARLDALEKRAGGASKRYLDALARSPGNASLMEALARTAASEGKKAEAMQWLERGLKENPDNVRMALRLVEGYARTEARQKALVLAQKLEASHPDNIEVLGMLAHVSFLNGNYSAAAEEYAKLARIAPNNAALHARYATVQVSMNDLAGAEASLRKALAIDPGMAGVQLSLLNVLVGQKKFPSALALAKTVQQRQPASPNGYKLEGDVLSAQDLDAGAARAYERALSLQPSGALMAQLHRALAKAGKAADANTRMSDWLSTHPRDIAARIYYASSLLVAKDYEGAAEHLHAVLRFEPSNVLALNDLAWASQQLKRADALSYAERAYKLAPASPAVLDTLGWILYQNGDIKRALPLLQKASLLAPASSGIRLHYVAALAKSGDKRATR